MKTINTKNFLAMTRDLEDLIISGETRVNLGNFDDNNFEATMEYDSLGGKTIWLIMDGTKRTMCDADTMYVIDIALVFWTYINA